MTDPLCGFRRTGDPAEQRRLPGAVRAEDGDDPARVDLERDVADGHDGAVGDREPVHDEQRLAAEAPGAPGASRPSSASLTYAGGT